MSQSHKAKNEKHFQYVKLNVIIAFIQIALGKKSIHTI